MLGAHTVPGCRGARPRRRAATRGCCRRSAGRSRSAPMIDGPPRVLIDHDEPDVAEEVHRRAPPLAGSRSRSATAGRSALAIRWWGRSCASGRDCGGSAIPSRSRRSSSPSSVSRCRWPQVGPSPAGWSTLRENRARWAPAVPDRCSGSPTLRYRAPRAAVGVTGARAALPVRGGPGLRRRPDLVAPGPMPPRQRGAAAAGCARFPAWDRGPWRTCACGCSAIRMRCRPAIWCCDVRWRTASRRQITRMAEAWRPWRSYAVLLLWASAAAGAFS